MAKPLTVIGAGPVGSLLALSLARRGHEVRVFERRPDMRRVGIDAGRSINLAVSTRGLYALHQVGLDDEILRQAIPMRGRMVHGTSGEARFLRRSGPAAYESSSTSAWSGMERAARASGTSAPARSARSRQRSFSAPTAAHRPCVPRSHCRWSRARSTSATRS